MDARTLRIDVHLGPDDLIRQMRDEVLVGLTSSPKELQPKWFYDDRGSQLFEEITRLPEYYPTRREREILIARADEIAARTRADTLVELGSGTSEKTRILLDALTRAGTLRRFVPFDVSEQTLRDAAAAVDGEYPGVEVHAVVGDFDHHLGDIPRGGRRLIAFLGGTIGNFAPGRRRAFLSAIAADMDGGDTFLCGTDLVKDPRRLVAAYDDGAGVTAEFNRNVLRVLNRELGADFEPDTFEHVATYDEAEAWIEMALRSKRDQTVRVADLDIEIRFEEGECMRTEISAKFERERWRDELAHDGLTLVGYWTDDAGDFALSMATAPRRGGARGDDER